MKYAVSEHSRDYLQKFWMLLVGLEGLIIARTGFDFWIGVLVIPVTPLIRRAIPPWRAEARFSWGSKSKRIACHSHGRCKAVTFHSSSALKGDGYMPRYWVVGASWDGVDHQDQLFIKQGIWMLGWEDGKQPQRAADMQPGDRIAIKRMKGKRQKGIRILHLGIIKGVIRDTNKVICTVNWVATNLDRDVSESRGCFQSVHGPYEHDFWIQEVFCL